MNGRYRSLAAPSCPLTRPWIDANIVSRERLHRLGTSFWLLNAK